MTKYTDEEVAEAVERVTDSGFVGEKSRPILLWAASEYLKAKAQEPIIVSENLDTSAWENLKPGSMVVINRETTQALVRKLAEAKEVIEFYAAETTYQETYARFKNMEATIWEPIALDKGEKAREFLNQIKN